MAASVNRILTQTPYTDATTFAGTNSTAAALAYSGQLGQIYCKNDCAFQLVLFHTGTTTIAAGAPVMWQDYDDFVVTAKVSDSKRNFIAGVALGTVTAGNYGFIQVAGPNAAVLDNGDDDIASGDVVIMASTDGVVDSVAAGTAPTYIPLGVATAADIDTSNTVAVQITVPLNL